MCAVLEGDFINFEILNTHDTIIIGRGENVDLDLSNELGSGRIHRRHAQISIQVIIVWSKFHHIFRHKVSLNYFQTLENGLKTFKLKNLGHRRVVVNGQQLLQQDEIDLAHASLIQMESIDLIFSVKPLIS